MLHFASCCRLLFCLLLSTAAFAQSGTVSGLITDAENGEPLIAATIQAGDYGTVTDYEGKYELELPAGN